MGCFSLVLKHHGAQKCILCCRWRVCRSCGKGCKSWGCLTQMQRPLTTCSHRNQMARLLSQCHRPGGCMLLTATLCQAEQSTQGFEFRKEMCCISKSWASHCRSAYVRVSRSPWSQSKGGRSPLLLPSSSKASGSKSPWSGRLCGCHASPAASEGAPNA